MRLNEFEASVLHGIATGKVSKEIAKETGRSKATVDAYARLLCAKFEARSRSHLAALAVANGLTSIEELVDRSDYPTDRVSELMHKVAPSLG